MSSSPTSRTAPLPAERIHCLRALPDPPGPWSAERDHGATRAAITRAVVQLLRARTGRGPTTAKTEMSRSLALVSIKDCSSPTDRTLIDEGHQALAIEVRKAIYDGMRADAVAAVEQITGRRVAAYLTSHRLDPDLAVIAFHFGEPGTA